MADSRKDNNAKGVYDLFGLNVGGATEYLHNHNCTVTAITQFLFMTLWLYIYIYIYIYIHIHNDELYICLILCI